jgi:hypothetical protein
LIFFATWLSYQIYINEISFGANQLLDFYNSS